MIHISPALGVFIMMNNYFHDVAIAMLAASGAAFWIMLKRFDGGGAGRDATEYFLRIYKGMTGLARVSLCWILIGGVPRIIFYRDFEWANAVGRGQIPAMIVQHVLAFTLVGVGVYLWRKINGRVREIRQTTP